MEHFENGPTADEYLDRHLEPSREEAPKSSIPFFNDGLEWSYSDHDEVFSHNDGEVGLNFDCQHLEDEFVGELGRIVTAKVGLDPKLAKGYQDFFAPPMFVLRSLEMFRNEGGRHFALKDYLARPGHVMESGALVFVNPREVDCNEEAVNELFGGKSIFLSGNLCNLSTILTLCHELGHQQIGKEDNEAMIGYQRGRPISKAEGRVVLEEERNAWAFALRVLRPYIRKEAYHEVNELIHNYALTNHSNHIRSQVSHDWIAGVTKWIDDKMRRFEARELAKKNKADNTNE